MSRFPLSDNQRKDFLKSFEAEYSELTYLGKLRQTLALELGAPFCSAKIVDPTYQWLCDQTNHLNQLSAQMILEDKAKFTELADTVEAHYAVTILTRDP